jgi:hypothetical protein
VVFAQVPGDGFRAGVGPAAGELASELNDSPNRGLIDPVGCVVGSSRSWFERALAFEQVAVDQFADPALGDPVAGGNLGLGSSLENNGGDDQAGDRHQP